MEKKKKHRYTCDQCGEPTPILYSSYWFEHGFPRSGEVCEDCDTENAVIHTSSTDEN